MSSGAQLGMNDFIINSSFSGEGESFDTDIGAVSHAQEFTQSVDVIDGDFQEMPGARARKKRLLLISVSGVAVVGAIALGAIQWFEHQNPPPIAVAATFPFAAAGGSADQQLAADGAEKLSGIATTAASASPTAEVSIVPVAPEALRPDASVSLEPEKMGSIDISEAAIPTVEKEVKDEPKDPHIGTTVLQPEIPPPTVVSKGEVANAPAQSAASPTQAEQREAFKSAPPKVEIRKVELEAKTAAVVKKPVAQAKKVERANVVSSAPKENDAPSGEVKPLVNMTAAEIGLRFFTDDALSVQTKADAKGVTYRVGDKMPNGETILKLISSATTIVTDRRVIRVN